ncbi:MAG: class I adenylate-forming enzyme family protein [Deltaproteobacteria bacterium]
MQTLAEIEAQLSGPGGPFETEQRRVLGEPMEVFKYRPLSLVSMLRDSSSYGPVEYIVCDDLRITFEEHLRLVASTAATMKDRYDVGQGDRVAILAANCPEWIVAFWATLSLGAIVVGLNGWWVHDEILYGLKDCDPKILIGDEKRLARIDGESFDFPVIEIESGFDELCKADPQAELPEVDVDEDDAATILYTSGTTGRPKGVVCTHGNVVGTTRLQMFHGMRAMMLAAAEGVDLSAGPTANCSLNTTPLFHVSGLYAGVVTSLANGLKTVWTRGRFDAGRVMELIETEQVTNWGPMGTMLHRVINHPDLGRYDLSSIRNLGSGGAPISPELQERARQVFPNAGRSLGLGYGLTESSALATLNFGKELEEAPDSVGRPLPTVEIEIRDANGQALGEGSEGEIHIHGPVVMKEYWRRPRETAETILAGRWLKTGDVGCMKNGLLYIASRKRDLILRGGENVYPVEIEQCLEAHPGVKEAAVVGVDHEELGQEVKAIVVVVDQAPTAKELNDWAAQRLAYFKVPAHWELRTEALPRNATGKVLKHVLVGAADNPFVDD